MEKYRVHEVAKDFGVPTKDVTDILTKYATTPKNHMQALTDEELSLVFESLTQHHQVSGIQAIYADTAPAAADKKQPVKAETSAAKPSANNRRHLDEKDRLRKQQLEIIKNTPLKVSIPDEISVGELASRMKKTGAEVVKVLMKNGIMASLPQMIDYDTAALIAMDLGCKVEHEVTVTIEEQLIDDHEDAADELVPRAPVVVVMGHVDHGKTSCWTISATPRVAAGEAGGITQHIGAYQVQVGGAPITFLDTPGHEAFTSMRARGAMITDIAILVVAADDGVMPQTMESINHAKAAKIPIVVAINKIDKPDANPEHVMKQLTEYGLVPRNGAATPICCPISAKTGMGIDKLLEMVLLTAEMLELKANPNRAGQGHRHRGPAGQGPRPHRHAAGAERHPASGRRHHRRHRRGPRAHHERRQGQPAGEAGPSVPVEIAGPDRGAPAPATTFFAVADERMARELVEQRKAEEGAKPTRPAQKVSLENLFDQIQAGERKELALIVKADVQGSVEAVKSSLEKLSNEEVNVRGHPRRRRRHQRIRRHAGRHLQRHHRGLQRPPGRRRPGLADRMNVDMRMYRVIYDCINEIESAMKGMLAPKFKEAFIGPRRGAPDLQGLRHRHRRRLLRAGRQAGARTAPVRVVRDGIVIHEGELAPCSASRTPSRRSPSATSAA
jgi:translation initiation factor IF-2